MNKKNILVSLVLLAAMLASACNTATPAPAPTAVPLTQPAAAVQPTGAPQAPPTTTPKPAAPKVMRMRYARDPKTLEPGLFGELVTGYISKDLHAGLLRFDDKMQPSPYIAKNWEISPDGLIYTFKLRDDVKLALASLAGRVVHRTKWPTTLRASQARHLA